jgi:Skp family chaperone for outer membrane proteins
MKTSSRKGFKMKLQSIVIVVLLSVVISLGIGYEQGWAQGQEQIKPARIATVSVNGIFMKSTRHAQWQQEMDKYKTQADTELNSMKKEWEAIEADMKTRKVGSRDYLERMQSSMEKKAALEAKREFYNAEVMLRIQGWTEQLYQEILAASAKIAEAKGFDMIVAKRELQFPSGGMDDLMDTIRSNAVLYNSEQMDITAEVLAAVDAKVSVDN